MFGRQKPPGLDAFGSHLSLWIRNPAVEDQAIDRVHRLGQRREVVHIYRFIVRDTVENQMLEIQVRAPVVRHF
jgi:hypothetical protein